MSPANRENILIIASSEQDSNLYYATRFIAPDSFCFLQIRGKKYLLMSDLEVDRARKTAKGCQAFSLSKLSRAYQERHKEKPKFLDLILDFARSKKANAFTVPGDFAVQYADLLRKRGLKITCRPEPFFPERTVKTPEEIRAITHAIRQTEDAVTFAIAAMRKSVIKKGKLYLHGEVLTSERIKQMINVRLMENSCVAAHSIVACGIQGVDPHEEGHGPLYAHQPIIMDIFPRDSRTRYFADLSRTVVKGKASPKLKAMYRAVKDAQDYAFQTIREGADASIIHNEIMRRFDSLGFKTGLKDGRMQGFFHSTGHGLGLDIHELPRISVVKDILKAGQVVTVEPGLYYADSGGVRLEDVVVITKTGCKNLTVIPKILEI